MKSLIKLTLLANLKDRYISPSITPIQLLKSQNLLTTLSNEMEIDYMEDLGTWQA